MKKPLCSNNLQIQTDLDFIISHTFTEAGYLQFHTDNKFDLKTESILFKMQYKSKKHAQIHMTTRNSRFFRNVGPDNGLSGYKALRNHNLRFSLFPEFVNRLLQLVNWSLIIVNYLIIL